VRCALLHYQFEAIHPFRDGNGRIGRLLITLFLIATEVLTTPLLYLSAYFERNRAAYYDHLLAVCRTGDFLPWLQFFLAGVAEQASDAVARARTLRLLHDDLRKRLVAASESANAFRLLDALFMNPFTTRPRAAMELGITNQGARNLLRRLEQLGVLRALPATRPERFVATEIVDALSV
jgi:Fic family protein